mmetsp:Transcript_53010/g.110593  ORF Transcript_53010/g.110593 Transcript_53010/m.110593 type:complete len:86 (-) Transcript_53010:50-307(-)
MQDLVVHIRTQQDLELVLAMSLPSLIEPAVLRQVFVDFQIHCAALVHHTKPANIPLELRHMQRCIPNEMLLCVKRSFTTSFTYYE